MTSNTNILVIGGGVIGVCSAYYLAKAGCQVTMIDKGEICSGASYGNAGLISPSHCVPLAAPGVITHAIKWMFDRKSPFYIKPRIDLDLWSWMWRFRAACKEEVMLKSLPVLYQLGQSSAELFRQLASLPDLNFGYQTKGCLNLFATVDEYNTGVEEASLLEKVGIDLRVLTADEVSNMEPCVSSKILGGIYFPGNAHLIPSEFVQGLACLCEKMGVQIKTSTEVLGFRTFRRKISTVETTRGDFQPDQVVIAGGAWLPCLTHLVGMHIPIQPAKGYSITVKMPDPYPATSLILSEARVAVTPMGDSLRFAGTLELDGFDLSISRHRVDAILHAAKEYLSFKDKPELIEIWRGLRPCTPDGLPVTGRSTELANLVVAGGHGTLGVSLGPITGMLVSQIITDNPPVLDLTALRPERFSHS
jgi:D-amino-acid dehydrogenase